MAPTFLSRNIQIAEARTIGATGDHLLLKVRQDGISWKAIAFGMGGGWVEATGRVDLVYSLRVDRWNGQETLRLMVKDWRLPNGY